MKIALTGSQGFVAGRFYEHYKNEHDFILLNRSNIDITDEKQVYRLFRDENIDAVFHAAAIADIGVCRDNPELARQINTQAAVHIAKGCALKNSILVFASSDQVFSANTEDGPYTEETVPNPGNVYAKTKLAAENEIAAIVERYYHLRLTWMFSMPERNRKTTGGILLNILRALMNNEPVQLNENAFRGFTYVHEVIENFAKIIQLPCGIYHAGSENHLSAYEIGEVVLDALHLAHRSGHILQRLSGERQDLRISNEKLKKYGVTFSDSEKAIRRCIREFIT